MTETKHGYLVLADISGYTGYLARVELEHAHEILSDLLEGIVEQFKNALVISKLEGDAVFAYANEEKIARPESLLELIETTYISFRRRRDGSQRSSTCTCRACQNTGSLELKFFVHHGDYIVQSISGIRELVGSDVNLVHRLMKNHITEKTGWPAYVLFTEKALHSLNLPLENMHEQEETYEHLGPVQTRTFNLHPRYEELILTQRVLVSPEEADMIFEKEFSHPVNIVWDWIMDISKRNLAMDGKAHWKAAARNKGRTLPGSTNHCAHGKGVSIETILDWRPFEYSTVESRDGGMVFRETMIFTTGETDGRTKVKVLLKLYGPRPVFLSVLMFRVMFKWENPYLKWFAAIESHLNQN